MARRCILSWFMLVPLVLTLACGPSATPGQGSEPGAGGGGDAPRDPSTEPEATTPPIDPTRPAVDPSDPGLEVDPQRCATDADCMVGTPRNCCVSFCPEDRQAWSRAAWAAYQDDCAVEECASTESLACQPERDVQPPPQAVCVRERCVLR